MRNCSALHTDRREHLGKSVLVNLNCYVQWKMGKQTCLTHANHIFVNEQNSQVGFLNEDSDMKLVHGIVTLLSSRALKEK